MAKAGIIKVFASPGASDGARDRDDRENGEPHDEQTAQPPGAVAPEPSAEPAAVADDLTVEAIEFVMEKRPIVGGSKGGVGKSIVSMTLIDHLRKLDKKVVLIESDTSNPDVWKAYNGLVKYKSEISTRRKDEDDEFPPRCRM